MAVSDSNKNEIKLAINEHLHLHGPRKWPVLLEKFPDTSRATIFRWIKEVREDIESKASSGSGADLKLMQKRIKSKTTTQQTTKQLKANLPVAPSPAVLVGLGDDVNDVFNFIAHFNSLVHDTNMMREASVAITAEGGEKLKNPMLMDKSIGRRLELIETWLRSQDMVWNFERMQELYFMIIEEVGKADVDTQQAILSRIRTLNNKRGMTIDARLF